MEMESVTEAVGATADAVTIFVDVGGMDTADNRIMATVVPTAAAFLTVTPVQPAATRKRTM